ncbi:MAG: endonuclease/exonuclease/phosphatase family protein [Jiangellaceae bacterium]
MERAGAQVAGLQEVDRHWGERSGFVDQAGWLARRLRTHVSYVPVVELEPLVAGERHRQYGLALLSTFPIVRRRRTLLAQTLAGEQRGVLEAGLDLGDGDAIRVLVTHLEYSFRPARIEQARTTADMVEADPGRVLHLGDLNASPVEPEVTAFTQRLRDAWAVAGTGPGFTFEVPTPTIRIDYVLAGRDLAVGSAAVVESDASDHLPVVVDVDLPWHTWRTGAGQAERW